MPERATPRRGRHRVRARRSAGAPALLRAKLIEPNLGEVLARPRLIEALRQHAGVPLTLVVAEAGYGKTVLLASFAGALRRPAVWYSLSASDADPIVFGRHLLEGFRRDRPRFGRDFERALLEPHAGSRSAEMLGGVLAHAFGELRGPPRLLVLDDFHEVAHQPALLTMVGTLLRYLPPTVRIAITARTEPALPLQRMRSRGEVFELHSEHLRYSRDEMERLFRDVYRHPLAPEDLDALERTTLGWPTAVHLVRESLRQPGAGSPARVLVELESSDARMHAHLSAEVLAGLDEVQRRLLEHVAPLARIEPELAAALAGLDDARPLLEGLARKGLLHSFGSGAGTGYECHELIRRFIRSEIEARGGRAAWLEREARAAHALEARGLDERAAAHFVAAEAWDDACRLLARVSAPLLREGRAASLLALFQAVPPERLRAAPALLVAHADAELALGHWDDAHTRYAIALERTGGTPAREDECRAVLGLARVLQMRGRHEDVIEIVDHCVERAGTLPVELEARLLQRKAGAHYYMGQFDASLRLLARVRAMLPASADPELLVPVVHNQAIGYAAQGRHREAAREFRAALAQVRGSASPRAPLYMSNLALLLTYQGELAEARRVAEEGLAAARRFANRAHETACLEVLAQILAESGDLDGALAAIRAAEELNDELRMELLSADLLGLRGRIFCARGQYRRAVSFLSQAVERLGARAGSPRLVEFRATLAWCELRAGRLRVARDHLEALIEPADRGANDYERAQVHYWMAEALLGLGQSGQAGAHLSLALGLARERGYEHFLRVQAREEPGPLLHALARHIEPDVCAHVLAECGGSVERALLDLLPDADDAIAEAVVAVLGEVGGPAARGALEPLAAVRPGLGPAIRRALHHVEQRLGRITAADTPGSAPRLVLFGPPRIEIGGRPLPASAWRAQRAFHVLVYLALHPRGATRDELLDTFWPGRRLAAGRRNFHPTLSYIRSVLPRAGAPPLLREAEIYRMNPDYPLACDYWDFDASLDAARGAADPLERRRLLERAVALCGAPLLEGLYGDWAGNVGARARDRIEAARLELGDLCLATGDAQAALAQFRAAAELDPYRESTRVKVIESHVRLGNRRAAIVEFDRLRGLLRAELSVDPLPETEEAVRGLMAGASPELSAEHAVVQQVAPFTQSPIKPGARGSAP